MKTRKDNLAKNSGNQVAKSGESAPENDGDETPKAGSIDDTYENLVKTAELLERLALQRGRKDPASKERDRKIEDALREIEENGSVTILFDKDMEGSKLGIITFFSKEIFTKSFFGCSFDNLKGFNPPRFSIIAEAHKVMEIKEITKEVEEEVTKRDSKILEAIETAKVQGGKVRICAKGLGGDKKILDLELKRSKYSDFVSQLPLDFDITESQIFLDGNIIRDQERELAKALNELKNKGLVTILNGDAELITFFSKEEFTQSLYGCSKNEFDRRNNFMGDNPPEFATIINAHMSVIKEVRKITEEVRLEIDDRDDKLAIAIQLAVTNGVVTIIIPEEDALKRELDFEFDSSKELPVAIDDLVEKFPRKFELKPSPRVNYGGGANQVYEGGEHNDGRWQ